MTDEVLIGREGALGIVALNRPRAINALSEAMIDTIYAALLGWRDDDAVRGVLFEGNGERGFCAGGDVRATRLGVIEGRTEEALRFYAREYRNNLVIATYPKPIVVLAHGIVMGGGIGLAGHASLRIAVEGAHYAMPEAAIGLFCDVGVNARLAHVPAHRALLFEFLGLPVGPADAIALDLADLMVPTARVGEVREALIAAAAGGLPALTKVAARFAVDPGRAAFCATADRFEAAFGGRTAGEIVHDVARMASLEDAGLVETLQKRCPTSLEAILESYRLAVTDSDVGRVLDRDLGLARALSVRNDFVEGVRAVLVDKDNNPAWLPSDAAEVDRAAIRRVLAGD